MSKVWNGQYQHCHTNGSHPVASCTATKKNKPGPPYHMLYSKSPKVESRICYYERGGERENRRDRERGEGLFLGEEKGRVRSYHLQHSTVVN